MALLTCPECSHQISDQAISCPHCGYPLARRTAQFNIHNVRTVDVIRMFLVVGIVVVAMISVWYYFGGIQTSSVNRAGNASVSTLVPTATMTATVTTEPTVTITAIATTEPMSTNSVSAGDSCASEANEWRERMKMVMTYILGSLTYEELLFNDRVFLYQKAFDEYAKFSSPTCDEEIIAVHTLMNDVLIAYGASLDADAIGDFQVSTDQYTQTGLLFNRMSVLLQNLKNKYGWK